MSAGASVLRKGKSAVRRARKATGLLMREAAGLPNSDGALRSSLGGERTCPRYCAGKRHPRSWAFWSLSSDDVPSGEAAAAAPTCIGSLRVKIDGAPPEARWQPTPASTANRSPSPSRSRSRIVPAPTYVAATCGGAGEEAVRLLGKGRLSLPWGSRATEQRWSLEELPTRGRRSIGRVAQ